MPVLVSIGQILKAKHDDPISGVAGKIKSIFERNTGKKGDKEWSVQKLILADPQGGKDTLTCKVWGKDALPESLKGRTIFIYSEGGKGVWAESDTYKGKTTIILKVTQAGTISLEDPNAEPGQGSEHNGGAGEPGDQSDVPEERPPTSKPPAKPKEKDFHEMDAVDRVIAMRKFLARRGNTFRMCADEQLRTVEGFCLAHGVAWDATAKIGVANQIAENMTQTMFTTLFLSFPQLTWTWCRPATSAI